MNIALKSYRTLAVVAAVVVALAVTVVLVSSSPEEDQFPYGTPEEFLQRVEAALASQQVIAVITSDTAVSFGEERDELWSSVAWFDFGAQTVRTSLTKAPGSDLDMPDSTLILRVEDEVYVSYPGTGDSTERYMDIERPACLDPGPDALVVGLMCGLSPVEGEWHLIEAEGPTEFRGIPVDSLAAYMNDGRVMRLLVDRNTYLPVGHTVTRQDEAEGFVMETAYRIDAVERGALPPDFFEPRGVGYVEMEERWLDILDDPALRVPVYWPGTALTGKGQFDAVLTAVQDRRGGRPGAPAHVLTLTYEGNAGWFRLDYWPTGSWNAFRNSMEEGFLWGGCSEEEVIPLENGEMTLLRGFEPRAVPEPPAPQPRRTPGTPPPPEEPPFNPFPDGCPEGGYDRFMGVVRLSGVTVTINAPYGLCCQDGVTFGVYDSEEAMRIIAEELHLREPDD